MSDAEGQESDARENEEIEHNSQAGGDEEGGEEKNEGEEELDENGEPKPDPNAERNEFHAKLKEGLS